MGDHSAFLRALRMSAIVSGAALAVAGAPAHAGGTESRTLPVRLNVSHSCTLDTNTLNFGLVVGNPKSASASTTMSIKCTPGTIYTIGIDNGQNWDGTTRRMWGGQANGQVWYANYQLYRDPLHLLPWGSTLATSAVGVLGLTGRQTLTVYGEAQLKNVRSSGYRDTVTVVLDF